AAKGRRPAVVKFELCGLSARTLVFFSLRGANYGSFGILQAVVSFMCYFARSSVTRPMTILHVDDDPEDVEIFCDAVKQIDPTITCLVAQSAEEALELLHGHNELPEYVFLDINMPKIDGNTCLQLIRRHDRFRDVNIIMYSTHLPEGEMHTYQSLNAGFLTKPNSYGELIAQLTQVLVRKD